MSELILKRIDSKLTHLLNKPKKEQETWVKSSVIIKLTGWTHMQMYRARANHYVIYKKINTGFWYLLESINPIFYKNKQW